MLLLCPLQCSKTALAGATSWLAGQTPPHRRVRCSRGRRAAAAHLKGGAADEAQVRHCLSGCLGRC